jgi:NAD(P)-dependent dehydrogenase (short-subunit alcohol dehydrogenase family)
LNVRRPTAVVTGGTAGIGRAVATALARAGYDLTICGRRPEPLSAAASELRAAFRATVCAVPLDIGEAAAPERLISAHVDEFGSVDALVTCAATYAPLPALAITPEAWDAALGVNLRGSVLCGVAAGRHMARAGRGRIVFVGSVNGFHAEPESTLYNVAKAALSSAARSFAVDLAGKGVVTNVLAPGWTDTESLREELDRAGPEGLAAVNPLARAGRPEEIAEVVRYLVVDAPEYMTGQTIYVDGGQTGMAPKPQMER